MGSDFRVNHPPVTTKVSETVDMLSARAVLYSGRPTAATHGAYDRSVCRLVPLPINRFPTLLKSTLQGWIRMVGIPRQGHRGQKARVGILLNDFHVFLLNCLANSRWNPGQSLPTLELLPVLNI